MTLNSGNSWGRALLIAVIGITVGAGAMYLWTSHAGDRATPAPAPALPGVATGPAVLTIPPDVAIRAGIRIAPVEASSQRSAFHVPGHIEANGYSLVTVKSTTAGRVTSVQADLGTAVRPGAPLGQIFSPEVADQQRVYLSMRAERDAAHARLARAERLVALGSVSQQELESARADHTTHSTDVEGARARLILLGVSADRLDRLTSAADIVATADILSSSAGTVISRSVNAGQNIASGDELFVVADLSAVWIIADVFERDAAQLSIGTPLTITSPSDPNARWNTRVSYIDPRVASDTRTVRVRAELSNPAGALRLGQYVDVAADNITGPAAIVIPKSAVQQIGDRSFVYVATDRADQFIEREVRLGHANEAAVEILEGLNRGERLVTEGSFFLRAERDRIGLPLPRAPGEPATGAARQGPASTYDIAVTDDGFTPSKIDIPAGTPVTLRFKRTSSHTCGTSVSIPSLGIARALPLNESVSITLPAQSHGEIEFTCGTGMLRGTLVVRHVTF